MAGNVGVLLADRLWRLGLGFALEVWMARTLGVELYGRWVFITATVMLFGTVAHLGLEGIALRDLVRRPEKAAETLGSVLALKGTASLLACGLAVSFAVVIGTGDISSTLALGILSTALVFQTTEVFGYWFQAHLQSKYVVAARNLGFLAGALGKAGCLGWQASLPVLAFCGWTEMLVGALVVTVLYFRRADHTGSGLRFSSARAREILRDSWPLFMAALAVAANQRLDLLLVRTLSNAREAGLYGVAVQLSEMGYFLPPIFVSTLLPAVLRARTEPTAYRARLQGMFDLSAALAYGLAVPLSLGAPLLMRVVYGPAYTSAAPVLAVHAWTSLFIFLGVAQSAWHLSEGLTRLYGMLTLAGAVLNLVLNAYLVPRLGAFGAAWANLGSYALSWFALNALLPATRPIFWLQVRALWPFGRLIRWGEGGRDALWKTVSG